MVNSVLSALPTYYMGNVKLPPTVYKQIDKYRKHCMWRGSDLNARKPPLATWKLAIRPKRNGGLGILDLATQNDALLLKNLHKLYNRWDIPWVQLVWNNYYQNGSLPDSRLKGSYWWKAHLKLITKFKGISLVQLKNGSSASLWEDMWNNKFSYTSRINITVERAKLLDNLHDIFQIPLSAKAYQQYTLLNYELQELTLTQENDIWSYIWGTQSYSVPKAYKSLSGHMPTHPLLKLLWKTKCQPKHRVFFWLLLQDKLNTRDRLRRSNMHLESYTCKNCILQRNETSYHLFLRCNFARACWSSIGLIAPQTNCPFKAVMRLRSHLNMTRSFKIIILMS
jgi:hypothetical protein